VPDLWETAVGGTIALSIFAVYPANGLHMEISDQLNCLFSAPVEERGESYVIEVPARELRVGELTEGEKYRVALLPAPSAGEPDEADPVEDQPSGPPVEEGDERTVEIEDIGDQGDGITRVERGFVVIVPGTDQGERVRAEITEVRENVAFAEVTERLSYYE